MSRLIRPDYVENDKIGRMIRLFCKVCGVEIGEYRRGNFIRHTNYAEMKIQFEDGTKHVTNMCTKCMGPVSRDKTLMIACHRADIDVMVKEIPAMARELLRARPKVVTIDKKRRGIP